MTESENWICSFSPIFILGYPRSGTSLLRSLINSHEEIVIPPECGFIEWLNPKFKNTIDVKKFVEQLMDTKKIEGWGLNKKELEKYILSSSPQTYQQLCYLTYKFYGESLGKNVKYWGDKNNYYIEHLDELGELFPKAKYIWLVRNPKDVVASQINVMKLRESKYKPNFSSDILELVTQWLKSNKNISKFLRSKPYYFLTYEKLLTSPEKQMSNVFDFIGIDDSGAIENFNNNKFFDEPKITMDWKHKLKNNIESDNIYKYGQTLDKQEVESINKILKKENFEYKSLNWSSLELRQCIFEK